MRNAVKCHKRDGKADETVIKIWIKDHVNDDDESKREKTNLNFTSRFSMLNGAGDNRTAERVKRINGIVKISRFSKSNY